MYIYLDRINVRSMWLIDINLNIQELRATNVNKAEMDRNRDVINEEIKRARQRIADLEQTAAERSGMSTNLLFIYY